MSIADCGVCQLHGDALARGRYEIGRGPLWTLRHHPDPAPRLGWLLLDASRHVAGPIEFTAEEAAGWGPAVQRASQLVQQLCGSERVYAIAFGEGARHLHLHLIPRLADDPDTEAWRVADLYRAVAGGERPAVESQALAAWVHNARRFWEAQGAAPYP